MVAESTSCDTCTYFVYDEDCDGYVCLADMDEDDYIRLVSGHYPSCPYYQSNNEYEVVRKQM